MKPHHLLALPFGLSALCLGAVVIDSDLFDHEGLSWANNLSLLACLLCVPVLARRKLWLGYGAVLFPLLVFVLQMIVVVSQIDLDDIDYENATVIRSRAVVESVGDSDIEIDWSPLDAHLKKLADLKCPECGAVVFPSEE